MEEGNHTLWPILVDHRNSCTELLRRIRVNIAEHDLKEELKRWIQDCRSHVENCRDLGLQIVSDGGTLRKMGDDGQVAIIQMTAADVLEIYRERVEKLRFYEAKVDATHGPGIRISPGGSLGAHEDVIQGWHTLDRHVNRTIADLQQRLGANPKLKAASAFTSRIIAEGAAGKAMAYFEDEIREWLAGKLTSSPLFERTKERFVIKSFEVGSTIGYVLLRGRSSVEDSSLVRVVLVREQTSPVAYRIKTGYPIF